MIDSHLYSQYSQHKLGHLLHHYFHSQVLQLGNRPWLSEVGKSEQVEYYELVGSRHSNNDHLPDNNFQFRLAVCLVLDPSAMLNCGDMMSQHGYERLDIHDGVFGMPFLMRQFDERV